MTKCEESLHQETTPITNESQLILALLAFIYILQVPTTHLCKQNDRQVSEQKMKNSQQ